MSGSASRGVSSGTIRQTSLPLASSSLACWTQTTGTRSRRALSTRLPTFATTASRSKAPSTTPFCTSTTRSAVFGRFSSVVTISPFRLLLRAHHAGRRLAAGLAPAGLLADHAQQGLLVRGAEELGSRLVEVGDLDRDQA